MRNKPCAGKQPEDNKVSFSTKANSTKQQTALKQSGTVFGFNVANTTIIMEQARENRNRGGHPGGNASGEREKQTPAHGFEGMNYEQRRAPYFSNLPHKGSQISSDIEKNNNNDRAPR